MKCSELKLNLALYTDGKLDESTDGAIRDHLDGCPLCRQAASDHLEIRSTLRNLARPDMSAFARERLQSQVRSSLAGPRSGNAAASSDFYDWLKLRVMPYSVGAFASVAIGFVFLSMMFSGMFTPRVPNSDGRSDTQILLAADRAVYGDDELSPSEYAQTRLAVSAESPSVNPQGALIALTKSLVRGRMKDDEVVVVAEVFGNGMSRVSEVIEPSRDRDAVMRIQHALESDPEYAPFVPASLDERPESVRVVLRLQSVNVSATRPRVRARL